MDAQNQSLLTRSTSSLLSFLALYLTTLFSLDTWAAARASPYRAPGANTFYRPAHVVAPDSYQAGMHGRGVRGPGSGGNGGGGGGGGARDIGRVDSRAPVRVGMTASCGACMQ